MRLNFSEPTTPTLSRQNSSLVPSLFNGKRHHHRQRTHPHQLHSRRKPRRWPLVFRFAKGSIHRDILLPVILHAIFTAFVVALDKYAFDTVGLPNGIIPSLSIVVGLMLVFRNQTCYNRFWDGRNGLTTILTSVRNLVRAIVSNAYNASSPNPITASEREDVERTLRILMAIPFAVKNHLREEWGVGDGAEAGGLDPEYASLLPPGFVGREEDGLSLPYELTFLVDAFVRRGEERGWFSVPRASQMQDQLNNLLHAYGCMETIMLTPIPVAHLVHQKQVLALFSCVLPFAMVDDMGWWAIPVVSLVVFTLYGIEGIGSQLEDPFGYDRNDIKMDAVVGDAKTEIDVVLSEWRRVVRSVESGSPERRGHDVGTDTRFGMPDLFLRPRPRTAM